MGPELTKLVEKYLPIVEELARAAPITGEAFAIHDAATDLMAAQAAFAAGDTAKGLTLVGSAAVNMALAMPGVGEVGRLVRLCVKAGIRLAKHEGAALLARLFEHKAEALAGAGGGVLAAEGRASGRVLASEGKAGRGEAAAESAGRPKTPNAGKPGTWVTNPGSGQSRLFGSDGKPKLDIDRDHDHGQGIPHAHDWTPNAHRGFPDRGPGRPLTPQDPKPSGDRGEYLW